MKSTVISIPQKSINSVELIKEEHGGSFHFKVQASTITCARDLAVIWLDRNDRLIDKQVFGSSTTTADNGFLVKIELVSKE